MLVQDDFIARTLENEKEVLQIIEENSSISTHSISRAIGISKTYVHSTF